VNGERQYQYFLDAALETDAVVIAAGAWTSVITARLGVRLPIQAGQGYHLDYAPPPVKLRHGLLLGEASLVITPTDGRLRLTGVMDVTRADDRRVHSARAAAMAETVRRYLHGWPEDLRPTHVWAGPRPIAADGMPVIGRLPTRDDAYVATARHMAGVLLGPVTGQAVAEVIITGRNARRHRTVRSGPLRPTNERPCLIYSSSRPGGHPDGRTDTARR